MRSPVCGTENLEDGGRPAPPAGWYRTGTGPRTVSRGDFSCFARGRAEPHARARALPSPRRPGRHPRRGAAHAWPTPTPFELVPIPGLLNRMSGRLSSEPSTTASESIACQTCLAESRSSRLQPTLQRIPRARCLWRRRKSLAPGQALILGAPSCLTIRRSVTAITQFMGWRPDHPRCLRGP